MVKGYKVRIYPSKEQAKKIISFCNASRYAYNWALNMEQQSYIANKKFVSAYDLNKEFTQFKKLPENSWLKDISNRALKCAIFNAATAYKNFFNHISKFPRFKSKKHSKMSCGTHEGTTIITDNKIRCEKIGWLNCAKHNIPISENVKYCFHTLSYDGLNFWFSVNVTTNETYCLNIPQTDTIGIDLGIKTLAVCSNGVVYKKPNINKEKKRIKRLQRKISKRYNNIYNLSANAKTKHCELYISNNFLKLKKQLNKTYQKITNKLNTNIHNFTKGIVKLNPKSIVIEDLDIKQMLKNRLISEKINDAKFYEIRRQFEYKCEWYGITLIVADKWFPSSKRCSRCGNIKKKLSLSERIYTCEKCGLKIDRDFNASLNLKQLAK